ncbi:MAG TPA: PEP/pyruvate-binding domain-containing protein [Nannocystaceae bacterium]|nr:PEP/pyruvate-binding domain-containing protein [Nannocystaceae bacterium]
MKTRLAITVITLVAACGDDTTASPDEESSSSSASSTSTASTEGSTSVDTTADTSSSDPDSSSSGDTGPLQCQVTEGNAQDYAQILGCEEDFAALASLPLDASIAGARSIKTLIDRSDSNALYYANSRCYPIHWDFASAFLSGNGLPPVPDLGTFNNIEYYSPDRRFLLGAVTYYEGPNRYVYELAPYDTADADMVTQGYRQIRDASFFGADLAFHPTSIAIEALLPDLGDDVEVVTTDELFADVQYQPYNLGETVGRLTFYDADEVAGQYIPFRDIAVLDAVPIDISITAGIITAEFQTPLAHINVLSVNRGTPNMGLRNAQQDPTLVALQGKNVRLTVDAFGYTVEEVTQEEADQWWEENRPDPLGVPALDLSVTDIRDMEDVVVDGEDLREQIDLGLTRFGSKGTNYAALYDIGQDIVPIQNGFVIPFYYYDQFMTENGLREILMDLEAQEEWADPVYREEQLLLFQDTMRNAPIDQAFVDAVIAKFNQNFPGEHNIRFRSSTNAEDLGTFTGAGLYNSQTGDTEQLSGPGSVPWAIKEAWLNIWNPRAYEERGYYSIDQHACAMALLTTPNFSDEEANGVAITNNIFDTSGLEPGFYVNVQIGENEVVQPDLGVLPDAYLHYFYYPGQPVTYITHSSLIPVGQTVLTNSQIYDLGVALDAIHTHFLPVYGNDDEWYGMDIEFKFDDKAMPDDPPTLYIKQARPFPWDPGSSDIAGSGRCDGMQE